jgi:hypothetical protein
MILDAINKSLPPTPGNLWPKRRDICIYRDRKRKIEERYNFKKLNKKLKRCRQEHIKDATALTFSKRSFAC